MCLACLVAVSSGHGQDRFRINASGNSAEIGFGYSANCENSGFDKIFQSHVVNALRGEDDIGTALKNLLDTCFGNVFLSAEKNVAVTLVSCLCVS